MSTTSGSQCHGQLDSFVAVGGGADDLDAVEQPEQRREAFADDALVVGDEDADRVVMPGTHNSTRKPSAVGPAVSVPPSSSARSRMPVSP